MAAIPGELKIFRPLDQIDAANFHSFLKIAWHTKSPDAVLSMTTPDGGEVTASSKVVFDQLAHSEPGRWAKCCTARIL